MTVRPLLGEARPEFCDPSPPNTCYAKDCGTPIPDNLLMCWRHWRRVPRALQKIIWSSNYLAHPQHDSSRLAARASIAAKEGRELLTIEREALKEYGLGMDGNPEASA